MRILAELLGKSFPKATKKDIERVIGEINRRDYSPWTKKDYKVTLKKFYKWLNNGEYPEIVKWIRTRIKLNEEKFKDALISEEEVKKMVDAAVSIRDKAFIWVLYESGARIGEILNVKLKNLKFEPTHVEIVVFGKTGGRKVYLVYSDPYLRRFVDQHPKKDNPNAWLWVRLNGEKWKYEAAVKSLKRIAKRAGIKKPIHPHLFRHSRATFLAGKLHEQELKVIMGWVKNSEMAYFYVHLNGAMIKEAYLKEVYGIRLGDEKQKRIKKCPRCSYPLPKNAKFCPRCGMALDINTVYKMEKLKKIEEKIMYDQRYEEIRRLLLKIIEEER